MRKLLLTAIMAVGVTSSAVFGQNAGVVWTAVKNSPFGGSKVNAIAWGKDKFVAVGDKGKIAYSPNGVNWTAVTKNPFGAATAVSAIAWGNGKFVAGGRYDNDMNKACHDGGSSFYRESGKIAYSLDGITWTEVKNDSILKNSGVSGIVWKNDRFTAGTWGSECPCADSECDFFSNSAHSPDGITWTVDKERSSGDEGSSFRGGIEGNGVFIRIENSDEGMGSWAQYSSDGKDWEPVENYPFGGGYTLASAWGGDKFVVIGSVYDDEGKPKNMIAYSSDGTGWTLADKYPFKNAANFYTMVWVNNRFIATGGISEYDHKESKTKYRNGEMAYSLDGITWTAVKNYPFGNSVTTVIVWENGVFVAGSSDGKLAYSK